MYIFNAVVSSHSYNCAKILSVPHATARLIQANVQVEQKDNYPAPGHT